MLRPATPLSILLFISFVLLLITTLSTPIIKSIPIASYENVQFGVFGYCQDGGSCSGIKVGYTTDGLFPDNQQGDFNLPSTTRHSLSSLLIVHPVAALCNLIVLALAVAAHFHSPSHSARYLLALLILLLPTLLVTLLAFLVDILIFVPYLKWGGWIVLASTILITASGVVTCAMRRTLVSRKARKRRIAENAEMSGENFYNRQEEESKMNAVPSINTDSKVPLVNGSPRADNLPAFTAYNFSRPSQDRHRISQQQVSNGEIPPVSPINEENRYYANQSRSNSRPPPGESGIPLAPINTRGSSESPYGPPPDIRGPSADGRGPMPPNGYAMRGGYGPPRGRGGFPPRGGFAPRGGFGPRGPPPPQGYGRGGFGPDMRGGFNNRGRGGYSGGPMAGGAMVAGAYQQRGPPPPGYPPQNRDVSPEGYERQPHYSPYGQDQNIAYQPVSPSQYSAADENTTTYVAYNQHAQSPVKPVSLRSRSHSPSGVRRSPSPAPDMPLIGQAVQMDAVHGRTAGYDTDVQGMVDLQQDRASMGSPIRGHSDDYIPPRTKWSNSTSPVDPVAPAHHAVTTGNRPRVSSNASGSYYEDVDPRFAETTDVVPALPQRNINIQQYQQPSLRPPPSNQDLNPESDINRSASFEDIPVGARSPAESETSHFTSVSQRGVNPNWRPGHGGEFNNFGPRRQAQPPRHDVLLANNPDFELVPPPARFGGRGGRGGFRGGPANGSGPGRMLPPSALGMNGDSPYPGPTTMREI